jgi:hypothetical protein
MLEDVESGRDELAHLIPEIREMEARHVAEKDNEAERSREREVCG